MGPNMPLERVFAVRPVRTEVTGIRLFPGVSQYVSAEVVFFRGGVLAVGTEEGSVSHVSSHVFNHAGGDTGGVRTVWALVRLDAASALLPCHLGSSLVCHLTITVQPHL